MLNASTQPFYPAKLVINMTEEKYNNTNANILQGHQLKQYKDINSKTVDQKTHSPIPKHYKEIIKQKDKEQEWVLIKNTKAKEHREQVQQEYIQELCSKNGYAALAETEVEDVEQ